MNGLRPAQPERLTEQYWDLWRNLPPNYFCQVFFAELQGRSVSDFVVAAAHAAAQRVDADGHLVRLAAEEPQHFVDLLLNPPPLAAALRRARKSHAKLIVE